MKAQLLVGLAIVTVMMLVGVPTASAIPLASEQLVMSTQAPAVDIGSVGVQVEQSKEEVKQHRKNDARPYVIVIVTIFCAVLGFIVVSVIVRLFRHRP